MTRLLRVGILTKKSCQGQNPFVLVLVDGDGYSVSSANLLMSSDISN